METLLSRLGVLLEMRGLFYLSLFLQTGSVQESDTVNLMKEMKFLAFKHKLRSARSHHQIIEPVHETWPAYKAILWFVLADLVNNFYSRWDKENGV